MIELSAPARILLDLLQAHYKMAAKHSHGITVAERQGNDTWAALERGQVLAHTASAGLIATALQAEGIAAPQPNPFQVAAFDVPEHTQLETGELVCIRAWGDSRGVTLLGGWRMTWPETARQPKQEARLITANDGRGNVIERVQCTEISEFGLYEWLVHFAHLSPRLPDWGDRCMVEFLALA